MHRAVEHTLEGAKSIAPRWELVTYTVRVAPNKSHGNRENIVSMNEKL